MSHSNQSLLLHAGLTGLLPGYCTCWQTFWMCWASCRLFWCRLQLILVVSQVYKGRRTNTWNSFCNSGSFLDHRFGKVALCYLQQLPASSKRSYIMPHWRYKHLALSLSCSPNWLWTRRGAVDNGRTWVQCSVWCTPANTVCLIPLCTVWQVPPQQSTTV